MTDLRSKLAASGTLAVPRRAGAALPNDVSLKVFRFATTQDLGRLGRTGTAWRDLSLRELTRLPGDWEVRRMAAPDHRVYFRSVAHERAQWEKPTRAAPPPAVDATSDGTPADVYPPQHNWPGRPAPRPKQRGFGRRPSRLGRRIGRRLGRGLGDGLGSWFGSWFGRGLGRRPGRVRPARTATPAPRPASCNARRAAAVNPRKPRPATGRWPGLTMTSSGARITSVPRSGSGQFTRTRRASGCSWTGRLPARTPTTARAPAAITWTGRRDERAA